MDFKLEAAIGGHGSRRRDLAGAFALEIRNQLGFTSLTFAPRLQWDKQIVPEHAIFFTTIAQIGYRMTLVPDGGGESDGYGSGSRSCTAARRRSAGASRRSSPSACC